MPLRFIKSTDSGATLGLWELEETVEELEALLPRLTSSAAYAAINHELRKREWLGARLLMQHMNLPLSLNYTEHGKPFYADGPKISMTHSRAFIAIITHPEREVGIDVQEIVEKVGRIRHKFCNEEELKWAKNTEDFTLIWSAKEAVFKIKEKNVQFKDDILVLCSDDQIEITYQGAQNLNAHILELDGYTCVYCVE